MHISAHVLLALVSIAHALTSGDIRFRYGVVIDAGSSGSRSGIYRWPDSMGNQHVPDVTEISSFQVRPGIATFVNTLNQIPRYIQQLVDHATNTIPEVQHDTTAIYFLATAGMRLLADYKEDVLLRAVNDVFIDRQRNPFCYNPQNTRILAGEEEGAFAWLAANYIRGYFSGDRTEQVGILELGGASTQIAFLPSRSPLANIFTVRLAGVAYRLYSHSYLNYGQDRAYVQTTRQILRRSSNELGTESTTTITHPCVLRGDSMQIILHGVNYTLLGGGNGEECESLIQEYLYQVDPDLCYPKPCAIGPFYQPAIPPSTTFYAIGAFYYPIPVFGIGAADGTVRPNVLRQAALSYCHRNLTQALQMSDEPAVYASTRCLTGLYTAALFTRAYGFDPDTTRIKFGKKVNESSIQWTLGAMISIIHAKNDLNINCMT